MNDLIQRLQDAQGIEVKEDVCLSFHPHAQNADKCAGCGHSMSAHRHDGESNGRIRIVRDGDNARIIKVDSVERFLHVGYWSLEQNMSGLYLAATEAPEMPPKLYGDPGSRADRILKTFMSRPKKGLGVMASGSPGTGKTVLAKETCKRAVASGIPVIIVRESYAGGGFASMLENLPTRCLFFIDEIEKIYSSTNSRNWLLSVLDGSVRSDHLFVMTCNDSNIGDAFQSRPGRIRYHFRYEGLEDAVIKGIINENLPEGKARNALHLLADSSFGALTPDALMSIIEECKIHGELPGDFMEFFNVTNEVPDRWDATGKIFDESIDMAVLRKIAEDNDGTPKRAKVAKDVLEGIKAHGKSEALEIWSYEIREILDNDVESDPVLQSSLVPFKDNYLEHPLRTRGDGAPDLLNIGRYSKRDICWRGNEFTVERIGKVIRCVKTKTKEFIDLTPAKSNIKFGW